MQQIQTTSKNQIDDLLEEIRIRIEKRAESKKDIIIFGFVLFLIGGIILISFYN